MQFLFQFPFSRFTNAVGPLQTLAQSGAVKWRDWKQEGG